MCTFFAYSTHFSHKLKPQLLLCITLDIWSFIIEKTDDNIWICIACFRGYDVDIWTGELLFADRADRLVLPNWSAWLIRGTFVRYLLAEWLRAFVKPITEWWSPVFCAAQWWRRHEVDYRLTVTCLPRDCSIANFPNGPSIVDGKSSVKTATAPYTITSLTLTSKCLSLHTKIVSFFQQMFVEFFEEQYILGVEKGSGSCRYTYGSFVAVRKEVFPN